MSSTPQSSSASTADYATDSSSVDTYDGVAVVGMACRVAGDVGSPEQLWDLLLAQKDGVSEIPASRWKPYYTRNPRNKPILDKATTSGYFVNNLDDFDCQFFGISPKEAEQMDPQQRVSLEVAIEALQDAGIPVKSLKGTDTSVFWGVNSDDYSKLLLEDLPTIDAWMGIGTAYCGVPNRISYHLDLKGPSVAVDAACASSLVAVHNGVSAILNGESSIAIVGGVNALYGPGLTTVLQRAGALASDGRCRSFDDAAKGYGRGEGAGAVILKNHAQAVRDGDHILGIIAGSAVAHDGRKNGIMAPNAAAQALVAKNALRAAQVEPGAIQYIEAHATSTPLGDPTEVSAMSAVYGGNRDRPCYIGSIKPNIGHLEAGAGVMGLIKALLAMQKGILPPQANLSTLNSRVDWKNSGLEVIQKQTTWPDGDGPRRAAVCSYGYGGTVSHAILQQYQGTQPAISTISATGDKILLISAPHKKRLPVVAESLRAWIEANGTEDDLASICTALATRRDHHEFRFSAVVSDIGEAIGALDSLCKGDKTAKWVSQSRCLPASISKETVWVFSGHGAQWTNMGKELLKNQTFCEAINVLDEAVRNELDSSPVQWLRDGDFESTDRIQILTYIIQVGIAAVLRSQGLFPNAVIGHSVGEIAASVVAGALSPVEGALVVTRRAVLYRRVMGQGAMVLVNSSSDEVSQELQGRTDVAVAISSSTSSCVIAGPKDEVALIADRYRERGIKASTVRTDVAFHSPMMVPLGDPLVSAIQDALHPTRPSVKLYSTALADPRGQALRDAQYWRDNMINQVRLKDTITCAVEDGYRMFLEVASHPIVSHSITDTVMAAGIEDFLVVPTMIRDRPAERSLLHAIGQLHCAGVDINWGMQMPGPWAQGLPTEPWLHQSTLPKLSFTQTNMDTHNVSQHSLVGHRVPVAGTDIVVYSTFLDKDSKPFPGDHPVSGTEIIPAACLLNTFLKATQNRQLDDVRLKVPVAVDVPRTVQIVVQGSQVKIMSQLRGTEEGNVNDASWLTHTTASWDACPATASAEERIDMNSRPGKRLADSFTIDYLARVGVSAMGFPWKVLEHYGDSWEMLARVDVAPGIEVPDWDPSSWAPFLDAATSIGSCIFFDEARLRMPSRIQQVEILTENSPPKLGWVHVRRDAGKESRADVRILGEQGDVLVKFTAMQFSEIEGGAGSNAAASGLVHRVAWPPALPAEEPIRVDRVVLVCSDPALMEKYAASLPSRVQCSQLARFDALPSLPEGTLAEGTVIAYIPAEISSTDAVFEAAERQVWELIQIVKYALDTRLPVKVYALTRDALEAGSHTSLANAPLIGLSRVIASEHPDHFGGLIDSEDRSVPLTAMKYIQQADVIRILDGLPRTARLRPLPSERRTQPATRSLPRPHGTYLITGGLGALGLATAEFLAENGARRLVLLSRRPLPARGTWGQPQAGFEQAISKIQELEQIGVSVHTLAIDIGAPNAAHELLGSLQQLGLPPVLGVVHAAGVLENELVLDSTQAAFHRVFAPKIQGALALHEAFPPQSVDFFTLFSSCGQLLGFQGQGSYGSANAFLDVLATHRRRLGDNAVSFQWTSWRGMGLGSDSDFVAAELEGKGVTDVTRHEAFQAWMHLAQYDMDHGVVLRTRTLGANEPVPCPVIHDIVTRSSDGTGDGSSNDGTGASSTIPTSGPELQAYLDENIRSCVAEVLQTSPEDVDSRAAMSDYGLDSVMSVVLRRKLQQSFGVTVPPNFTWTNPTVQHLVGWFSQKLGGQGASSGA
ncbi:acyl transferase domain-containing protein [Aspergillus egyptiacus]|nr:acyl transferase domain-containing protein [Aspergillus egyptiacus]